MKARENPFRVERIRRIRFRPQGLAWNEILERLEDLGYRAAVAGPDGSGKTTLLEDLLPFLEEKGFRIRSTRLSLPRRALPPEKKRELLAEVGPRDIIVFDGADLVRRLDWWYLRRASRQAGGLLVTTHTRRLLPILVRCRTSFALFREIVGDIQEDRDPRPRIDLREVYERHAGNIRDALRELYDIYSDL
jgi:hypothetical protein